MPLVEERIAIEPCGCHTDKPTGLRVFRCAVHERLRLKRQRYRHRKALESREAQNLVEDAMREMGLEEGYAFDPEIGAH